MAALYQRSNGHYYAQFFDATKCPITKQVSLRTKNQREALKRLGEFERDYENGRFDPWANANAKRKADLSILGAAVDAFIRSRSNLSPYTITKYRSVLGLFEEHLGKQTPVSAFTPEHVESFLNSTEKKAITKKTYATTLSPFFNWMVERDLIRENPIRRIRLERAPQKFPRFLKPSDVEAICKEIKRTQSNKHAAEDAAAWLLPIIKANVFLGLRAGELVNLRWEHIDFERKTLTVSNGDGFRTKSGKERVLPLSEPVIRILERMDKSTEYVFPNYGGKKLHRQYLSRSFKHFALKAGLNVNFHTTRHTAASWLAKANCGVEAIRRYMGHSSITVTQKYMHLSRDVLAEQVSAAFAQV